MICSVLRPAAFLSMRILLRLGLLTALTFLLPATPNATAHPSLAQNSQGNATLEPGKPIEQQVRDGQKYVYLLPLYAGQYCRLALEARTVIFRINSPAGHNLSAKNGDQFFAGQSRIDLIATENGSYVVEISQLSNKVDGRFTIKLEEARPTHEKDSLRLQARQLLDEVEALDLKLQHREIYRQSRPKLQQALTIWQASGDRLGEADCLFALGELYFGDEPLQEAVGYFNAALALYRQVGARKEEAKVLYELARHYRNLKYTEIALEHFQQSLALHRQLNSPLAMADTCVALGRFHQMLGEFPKALGLYHEAAQIYRAAANRNGLANVLENLGEIYLDFDDQRRALSYYEEAVSLWSVAGSPKGLGDTLIAIGKAQLFLGAYQRARDTLIEAVTELRRQGDVINLFGAFSLLGQTYLAMDENQKAVDAVNQAIAIGGFRSNDPPRDVTAFNYLCEGYVRLGEYERADEACREAQSLGEKSAYLPYTSITQGLMATIAIKRGDLTQARAHFETAIGLAESLRSKATLAAQRAALLGSKHRIYAGYIELLMELNRRQPTASHNQLAFQTSERARARSFLESLIEASADIRQGVEPELLAREKNLQKQLEAKAAEQTRLLSDKHTETQAAAIAQTILELKTEYERVESEIRQRSPHYAALTQPQPLSASEIQKEVVADEDTLLLEYALGEEKSFLWAISANSFNSYELPKGEIIEKAAQRVYDLLTARNQEVRFEVPEERTARIKKADADFQIAAAKLSRMILTPVAAELRRKRPKQLLIVADGKLQYVPFAALPLREGTRERGKEGQRANRSVSPSLRLSIPLVANYEIVKLPSASTLAVLRRELKDRKLAPKTLAVFADPVFEADDERVPKDIRDRLERERQAPATGKEKSTQAFTMPDELTRALTNIGLDGGRGSLKRLPFSREEANAILKFAPADGSFSALDFDANQETALKSDLSQYQYLHFATHGFLDNVTPELSGLVLSGVDAKGRNLDGYLRMVEIINMNLPAELVVLSACKTGLGKEVRGEGLMSLTRGFMYAGAARVMVSLWDVNDKSTASLMGEFYQGLLQQKLRPSAALRAAQLKMLNSKQWAAPYYWAAFEQLGEPR